MQYIEVPAQAPSFTSSSYSNKMIKVDARAISIVVDKKGYVRLHTSHGDLNVELHCDMVAKTCENFLGLCEQHYYDNVKFHRLIKGFMVRF
jgi:peptidyl-prolyl cis-trans isomerase-like protein 2